MVGEPRISQLKIQWKCLFNYCKKACTTFNMETEDMNKKKNVVHSESLYI